MAGVVETAAKVLPTVGGVLVGVSVYELIAHTSFAALVLLLIGLFIAALGVVLRKRTDQDWQG